MGPSTRLLTQLDPNLPPRGPSPVAAGSAASSPSDDLCPATPSKDKFREWTFPRAAAPSQAVASTSQSTSAAAASSSPQSQRVHNLVDGSHGRSSSVTPNKHHASSSRTSRGGRGAGAESMDLRHRSNASLAQSPSSPLLTRTAILSPAAPKEVARLVYSNVRRKSLNDLVFVVVFGACLLLFGRALFGVGFDGAAHPRSSAAAVRAAAAAAGGPGAADLNPDQALGTGSAPVAAVIDVQLPEGFLPRPHVDQDAPRGEDFLADVHQPHGDSSHDAGDDHFLASPDDPALSDEKVHDHHSSPDSLWPEDPAHLEREAEAAARPRPRPARLAPQVDDEVEVMDAEEARLVELVDARDGVADPAYETGEEPDVVYEGDEAETADDKQAVVVEVGDPEDDINDDAADMVPGELHVVDADDEADSAPGALSALVELLDSAQEEEALARAAATGKQGDGVDGSDEDVAREALKRAQRGREALARVQAKAAPFTSGADGATGADEGKRRMVRAKKVRR